MAVKKLEGNKVPVKNHSHALFRLNLRPDDWKAPIPSTQNGMKICGQSVQIHF